MFSLIPWKKKEKTREVAPYRAHPMMQLRDEFDALFDRFFSRWPAPSEDFDSTRSWGWGLDVDDQDDHMVVRAEAPGFDAGDLDVQVTGNLLVIKAEKKNEQESREGNGHHSEYRTFRRAVTLPPGTDPEKVEAKYKNGVLEVRIPKGEQARGKRIEVKA